MLNENIRAVRKSRGLSQEELAIKLNVVRQTVSKWERGLSVPDSDMLVSLSDTLDVPVATLLGEAVSEPEADGLGGDRREARGSQPPARAKAAAEKEGPVRRPRRRMHGDRAGVRMRGRAGEPVSAVGLRRFRACRRGHPLPWIRMGLRQGRAGALPGRGRGCPFRAQEDALTLFGACWRRALKALSCRFPTTASFP